ncbi:Rne/Rng family ribonuclease [Sphingomonas arenae]|uniref:Rne/Rng family ribonuclease n=1 Tax=Sphingomonas arenae TaxID=2812555 RepID=UPI001967E233|nr:ribonuclease E/G [Sphingomonas arenae]
MTMRMLIDARHPEETRVAVVKGNRIEEFDFESAEHKQLKGNIYLAKVTRVEPSLQAAFVEYGGNRHGFLAFSEIHPDYYQIPKSDRDALLREEAEHAAEEERLRAEADDLEPIDGHHEDDGRDDDRPEEPDDLSDADENGEGEQAGEDRPRRRKSSADEAADELRRKRMNLRRRYKIQDVIQRRQVLLVQVVKEERGNKGAALTTYLSLAGRYCVLMPNTSHGGGISRKISNGADRKRLKSIMADLKLPSTMGLIVRTAGLQRTKTEIKRDFDYLARLWDEVREKTLQSAAPALIYRDSDLIKRAIRDLYHREIDEVIVEGDEGYKAARGFMKLLMPSHVKRVRQHGEATPLFQLYGVEDSLNAMYQPVVQLKSGGYIVINPTEALVSIDINSGRSTREHNIEQTAYATNIEAAHEIARQLRLRDMAGLVVIDFIDMEQNSHVRKVEKAMKEALKNDRARIQVGRISSFGLMEMSRQRLRTGVLEASTKACPHCEGTGLMRTASSAGLQALRMIEDEAGRGRGDRVCLRAGSEAAVYVLNKKRAELADIEERYGVTVEVLVDPSYEGARMSVESSGPRPVARPRPLPAPIVDEEEPEVEEDEFEDEHEEESEERSQRGDRDEGDGRGGRRRRRRRRGGRNRRRDGEAEGHAEAEEVEQEEQPEQLEQLEQPEQPETEEEGDEERPRSRRGRRGGRRRARERDTGSDQGEPSAESTESTDSEQAAPPAPDEAPMKEPVPSEDATPEVPQEEEKPKARRRPRARKTADAAPAEAPAAPAIEEIAPEAPADVAAEEAPKPKRRSRAKKAAAEVVPSDSVASAPDEAAVSSPEPAPEAPAEAASAPEASNDAAPAAPSEPGASPRRGWWQRTFG